MTQWPTVRLGEAIELAYGKSLPKILRAEGIIPVYGSNGIAGWHDTALVTEPTVIVGRKGSAGAVQFVDEPCYPIDTTYFVRIRQGFDFDIKFLFYLLRRLDLSRLKTATGVPGLTREDAYQELIPVPPINEQSRIVDILSRAEGIVRLRREAQKKTAEIIPALFIDMFGDPATNPKEWACSTIGELFDVKGGKRLPKGVPYSEAPTSFRYIRGTDISPDYIERGGLVFLLPDIQATIARYVVSAGDVVITIAGKIGVAAPVGNDLVGVNLTENAAMIRSKGSVHTNAVFLSRMLNSEFVQQQIKALTGRVTIGKLALERVKLLEIRFPPIELQRTFAEQVEQIRSIQSQQAAATAKAEATFNALLARTFSGQEL